MLPRNSSVNPSQGNTDLKLQNVQYEKNVGAEYGDHIRNTGAICNTSASHTYGNVMAVVEKFILDQMPKDAFKTVTASSSLASRQIKHLPKQLHKNELPIMVSIPRVVFGQDEDRFLGHTIMNDHITNTHALYGQGSLLELAADPRKHIWVHGHYNRAVMYVDVVLTFNTYSEQLNFLSYIHNMIPIGHNQFIRAPLELYIPEEACKLIGHLSKIPVKDDKGSIYNFLTYMNTVWHHPITYKLKGGSNRDEFFMYYIADIDTTFQNIEAGQGVKIGQVKQGFDISFTVRCEFNTIGYFAINSPDIKKLSMVPTKGDDEIVTVFSDVINLNDFDLPIGWSILSWPIFKLQYGENSISINQILNQSLNVVIDYHLKLGIPMERFIKIQFRENGEILTDEAYYINWQKRELIITRPNYHRTYRLIVTVSHEYVNNLIKDLYNLE